MKRLIPLLILLLTGITSATAQTYDQLWKEESQAEQKDLPKTQIAVLKKISAKAAKEKAYGQLLASTLKQASLQTIISPDSLQPTIDRLTARAAEAEGRDEALAAVYHTVLGHVFTQNAALGDDHEAQGRAYYQKALAHPDVLGRTKAAGFAPFVSDGEDAAIFGDDLLNVIAREIGDWATLATYYKKVGNREAACYAELQECEGRSVKSEVKVERLRALIEEYGDLPICGEVAIALYDEMDDADATPKEKYEFCTEAINRWGTWPRIDELRNHQNDLTSSMLRIDHGIGREVVPPGVPQSVDITVSNTSYAKLTITRLDITGDTQFNPQSYNDLQTLKRKKISGTQQTVTRTYSDYAPYDNISDSIEIPGLPVGVYLLEFTIDDAKANNRSGVMLYRVTGVFPIYQPQPNATVRVAVVDMLTGQPIPHAKVRVLPNGRAAKTTDQRTLTTDAKGELLLDSALTHNTSLSIWAYTETDKASAKVGLWGYYSCNKDTQKRTIGAIYTDRTIYRPGQTVHASAIFYEREGIDTRAVQGKTITLRLRDANYKDVAEQSVKTDEFGTAAGDFTLPTDGLTGRFTVSADNYAQTSIQVEEYKRPTFEVELPEVTEAYKAGDTLTITGTARTYAGVPVQGAKVRYTVNRREAWWWWYRSGDTDEEVKAGGAITDADGHFTVRVPLLLPDMDEDDDDEETSHFTLHTSHFYNFVVEANVTDLGGESHEGSLSIPLGTKPTAFSLDMKDKFLTDSTKTLRFNYRNAAGKPIDGTVRLTIDGTHELTVKANETLDLEAQLHPSPFTLHPSPFTLHTGKHQLVALCGTDTITHDFIVFSLSDKRPVAETHDWFYISANEFPADGKPVYVQVGSSDPDQHILYSVFAGKKLLESGALDQSCALTNRKFIYKEEYGDGILVSFAWVKNGQFYTHSEQIRRPMPNKRMKLTWKTFRDRLTPGQDEQWTLAVMGPDGKPAHTQLMATLYDKSLDQLSRLSWSFKPTRVIALPSTQWWGLKTEAPQFGAIIASPLKSLRVEDLSFRRFDLSYFQNLLYTYRYQYARAGGPMRLRVRGATSVYDTAEAPMAMEEAAVEDALYDNVAAVKLNGDDRLDEVVVVGYGTMRKQALTGSTGGEEPVTAKPQLRENLAETAFFYPQLVSDAQGQVTIKFRLPESVTTWRFLGIAHDVDVNYGFIEAEAVAKKAVMVTPNVPRFVREGDQASLTARIFNTSDHNVSGKARLELIKASELSDFSEASETSDRSEYAEELPFVLSQDSTASLTFHLPATLASDLYIVRITAQGDGFSDGEQHYLPVLTNKEYVTTTLPLTFLNATDTTITLKGVYPPPYGGGAGGEASGGEASVGEASHRRLTVEYTQNPEWLAIQALPYMSVPDGDNAISLATAYFANTLGHAILTSHLAIRQAIELWQREQGEDKTLLSALEKNQELKTLVLKETPWVADADAEREQRQSLIRFFDENTLQNNLTTISQKLRKLQRADGSFAWWHGMEGSPYMTVSVVKTLTRLSVLLKAFSELSEDSKLSETSEFSEAAFRYLDKVAAERVKEMKQWEKEGHKNLFPSDLLCDYAYASALAGRKANADILYIIGKMEAAKSVLSIYGKANTAVILHLYGRDRRAGDHLKSLKEYTVYRETMGRYFDTPKAGYSWFDYRMPTQVAAIEALRRLTPNDRQTITEMQRWLLQEKRTTMWDTPINCVEAVYGSLSPCPSPIERGGDSPALSRYSDKSDLSNKSDTSNNSTLSPKIIILNADGILAEKETSPIATTKLSTPIASTDNLEVKVIPPLSIGEGQGERPSGERPSGESLSFGAIYAQYLQDMKDIDASSSGLTVMREVRLDGKPLDGDKKLKVGDRITIRVTIRADRDYDFVQVIDKRAACLEPVEQTSGYRHGCYTAPKDQETRYYFDRMAKGTHMVETEYYIDREGQYTAGTCTAQCAYAPEFAGRTGGQTLSVAPLGE